MRPTGVVPFVAPRPAPRQPEIMFLSVVGRWCPAARSERRPHGTGDGEMGLRSNAALPENGENLEKLGKTVENESRDASVLVKTVTTFDKTVTVSVKVAALFPKTTASFAKVAVFFHKVAAVLVKNAAS